MTVIQVETDIYLKSESDREEPKEGLRARAETTKRQIEKADARVRAGDNTEMSTK